jgi:hypothetical protein
MQQAHVLELSRDNMRPCLESDNIESSRRAAHYSLSQFRKWGDELVTRQGNAPSKLECQYEYAESPFLPESRFLLAERVKPILLSLLRQNTPSAMRR